MSVQKHLEFHIKEDDYFGTLATNMSSLLQDGVEYGQQDGYKRSLRDRVNELMWLSKNYKITRKHKNLTNFNDIKFCLFYMLKTLIVEDELDLREMYKIQFETAGAQVFAADNIEEGFKIAKKEKPDIVLVDLMLAQNEADKDELPKGYALLDKLKADKATKDIKVVIISNLDTQEARDGAKERGACGYIVKANVMPKDVVDKVREIVEVFEK